MEWLHSPCAGGRLEGCGDLKEVLVPLAAAQRRLGAPCPGTGTGAAAQRDCKSRVVQAGLQDSCSCAFTTELKDRR